MNHFSEIDHPRRRARKLVSLAQHGIHPSLWRKTVVIDHLINLLLIVRLHHVQLAILDQINKGSPIFSNLSITLMVPGLHEVRTLHEVEHVALTVVVVHLQLLGRGIELLGRSVTKGVSRLDLNAARKLPLSLFSQQLGKGDVKNTLTGEGFSQQSQDEGLAGPGTSLDTKRFR